MSNDREEGVYSREKLLKRKMGVLVDIKKRPGTHSPTSRPLSQAKNGQLLGERKKKLKVAGRKIQKRRTHCLGKGLAPLALRKERSHLQNNWGVDTRRKPQQNGSSLNQEKG